jgi:hypothetical protein
MSVLNFGGIILQRLQDTTFPCLELGNTDNGRGEFRRSKWLKE